MASCDGEYFSYEVTDYYGNVVIKERNEKYEGEGTALDLSSLRAGYYEITAYDTLDAGERTQLAKTSISILEEHEFASAENSYFGINMHMHRGSIRNDNGSGWTFDLIKNACSIGAMSIRENREWQDAEATPGSYSFGYENYAGKLATRNMDMIMATGFKNTNYDNGEPPYTDDGIAAFANYSKAAFDEYPKGLLKYQEMFNEWWKYSVDSEDNQNDHVDGTPEEYLKIAEKVYSTIDKTNYPDAVLFGEFSRDTDGWNKPLIDGGIVDCMDAAALHRYGVSYSTDDPVHLPEDAVVAESFRELREMMDASGGEDKPIWLTETGYTSSANKYGIPEELQAKYLPRLMLMWIAEGAEKVFWYDLLDDGYDKNQSWIDYHEYHFGLMRSKLNSMGAYSPKPAYVSFGVMARAVDGKTFAERTVKNDNIYRYRFADETSEMSALVALTPCSVTLSTNAALTVTDIMGQKKTYSPQNGVVTLDLTDDIIYIDGAFTM